MLVNRNKYPLADAVIAQMCRISDIRAAIHALGWDQEVNMPKGGIHHRSDQIATLEKISHEILTGEESARLVDKIDNLRYEPGIYEKRILDLFANEYKKALRLPGDFVEKLTKHRSVALLNWKNAVDADDYALFRKDFDELIKLKREESAYLDPSLAPYDAQLEKYEPGLRTHDLENIFPGLRDFTFGRLDRLAAARESSVLAKARSFAPKVQMKLAKKISKRMGLDYHHARLDKSFHPFSIALSRKDVRITTKISRQNPFVCLMSTIHETGHALYEQGIHLSLDRTFACAEASVALHESQSLFWENMIARSLSFCEWLAPELAAAFPGPCGHNDADMLFRRVNDFRFSLIRVDSDELTYNNHIMLRFLLERDLMAGKATAKDIPEMWNAGARELLGMAPSTLREGCMQDIHWAFGEFGYFPAYTLGTIFASSLMKKLKAEMPEIDDSIRMGEFSDVRAWLKNHIHQFGRLKSSRQIMQDITDTYINTGDFMTYMDDKIEMLTETRAGIVA